MGLNGAPHPPNLANGFARSPRISRLPKARIAGLAVIIIVSILLLPSIFSAIIPGTHTSNLERNAGSKDEMQAIMAAEDMDMAVVLGIERFRLSMGNGYLWSNVTDGQTIAFYQDRIAQLDREWSQYDANFEYNVDCQYVDRLLLFPSIQYGPYSWAYTMVSSNPNAEFEGEYQYIDLVGSPRVGDGYLLEGAYIIRQDLMYEEHIAGSYDLINELAQLVILDGDHELRVLMVNADYRTIPICY